MLIGFVLTPMVDKSTAASLPQLRVSENHRFLVTTEGRPFFWLADTAWELFHRLNREEACVYLEDRAKKGFTVIQCVLLAELDGLKAPNAYGNTPLLDNDPCRPDIKDGPNNDYWDHVDFIKTFTPPSSGRGQDWVLVLDDASKKFPEPGTYRKP